MQNMKKETSKKLFLYQYAFFYQIHYLNSISNINDTHALKTAISYQPMKSHLNYQG